ncbi:MAG: sulfurtransferase [Chromatiales bacterium]|nr:sulfurtransferase [Chromatiales bacterium]
MPTRIDASTTKRLIHGAAEVAFVDVREHGEHGEGHPLLSVGIPYSRLELDAPVLIPRRATPTILLDDGDGRAERAAARLEGLGYTDVRVLDGGTGAWAAAGHTLYKGVNVPSKAFGELVEHASHTPSIGAEELAAMRARGEDIVILDGRSPAEYRNMSIPDGVSCPNAELGYRIDAVAPDARTTVVVNCAGRTRSIIGAQTLIDLGVPHKVVALRNGTMGWRLAGLDLDHGATRSYPRQVPDAARATARERAAALAARAGVSFVNDATLQIWQADASRTLYLLDVRAADEFEAGHLPGSRHAPGGQLVQGTDQWVAVRGARIVLVDDAEVRAVTTAYWLGRMGHDVHVLRGGLDGALERGPVAAALLDGCAPALAQLPVAAVVADVASGRVRLVDVRTSTSHRKAHPQGARWLTRCRAVDLDRGAPIVLLTDDDALARLVARDLAESGHEVRGAVAGDADAWRDAGHAVVASPDSPPDAECIDYLFFVHDRHAGNLAAAQAYLDWETGLVGQLDADERALFT